MAQGEERSNGSPAKPPSMDRSGGERPHSRSPCSSAPALRAVKWLATVCFGSGYRPPADRGKDPQAPPYSQSPEGATASPPSTLKLEIATRGGSGGLVRAVRRRRTAARTLGARFGDCFCGRGGGECGDHASAPNFVTVAASLKSSAARPSFGGEGRPPLAGNSPWEITAPSFSFPLHCPESPYLLAAFV